MLQLGALQSLADTICFPYFISAGPVADILLAEGSSHLIVTHKSILRALLCVAMGLPKVAFRAVDIHNGGVCVFR